MTSGEFKGMREGLGSAIRVAAILGVQPAAIARWESGEIPIPKMLELAMAHLTQPQQDERILDRKARVREQYRELDQLNNAQAAEYLGVHRRTVLDWVKAGLLPKPETGHQHDGRQDRKIHWFRRADLDAFLAMDAERTGRRLLK